MAGSATYFELKLVFSNETEAGTKALVKAMLMDAGLSYIDAMVDGVDDQVAELDAGQLVDSEDEHLPMLVYDQNRDRLDGFSALVRKRFPHIGQRLKQLPDQLWAKPWRDDSLGFSTETFDVVVGDVRPSDESRTAIVIQKGEAFGDGRHVTTRVSLRLLERRLADLSLRKALDLGTGNGILAIALAKRGVGRVVATDLDQAVLDEARRNATLNAVSEQIDFLNTTEAPGVAVDLVVANILAPELIRLIPQAAQCLSVDGELWLSGFHTEDEAKVAEHATHAGFVFCDREEEDFWLALAFKKKSGTAD